MVFCWWNCRKVGLFSWMLACLSSGFIFLLIESANIGRFHPFYRPWRPLGRVELKTWHYKGVREVVMSGAALEKSGYAVKVIWADIFVTFNWWVFVQLKVQLDVLFLCILYSKLYMFWVLFAPILRSTTAAYSHRCVYGFGVLVYCSRYVL
jgi:hypothetical protein